MNSLYFRTTHCTHYTHCTLYARGGILMKDYSERLRKDIKKIYTVDVSSVGRGDGFKPRIHKSYTTSSIFFTSYLRASKRFLNISFFKFNNRKPAFNSLTNLAISIGRS